MPATLCNTAIMGNQRARQLRGNQTEAERRLWSRIRLRQLSGFRFRRQVPLGSCIVDFACLSEKLVIEVDGGQHSEQTVQDTIRTRCLEQNGFRVLRFWNHDVLANTDSVVQTIEQALLEAKNG